MVIIMNKTNRIRYFFLVTAICAVLSYYLGYQIIDELEYAGQDDGGKTQIAATEEATKDSEESSEVEISNMDVPYEYVIVEEEGYLTVYMKDLKTVYMYTDISYGELSDDLQQEISKGKKFSTLEELYNFLENYSS